MIADVKVTSVEQIIRLFGGELLYGRGLAAPLRELVQNASDAIRARRKLAREPFYEGKIVITLQEEGPDDQYNLIVDDDGIGMSEHVLVGPLIEFGKSFWDSQEARDEFPGLLSASLRHAGRYGIGFFSCLALTDQVAVTSRRWDAAQVDARTLTFREGLRLRPLVSDNHGAPLGPFSTRVALRVTKDKVESLLTVHRRRRSSFKISLKEAVAQQCPCVDCDIFVADGEGGFEKAHSRKWYDADPAEWVRAIVFANHRADEEIDEYIAKMAPLLRIINGPDLEPCGRAAIALADVEAGLASIGGLVSSIQSGHTGNFSTHFVGAMAYEPDGPKRSAGKPFASAAQVERWGTEQARLLEGAQLGDREKYVAAINVAKFGGDPTPIAMILINRIPTSLEQVYELLENGEVIYGVVGAKFDKPSIEMLYHQSRLHFQEILGHGELHFLVKTMEAWRVGRFPDDAYHLLPHDGAEFRTCFLSCLERYATSKRRILKMEFNPDMAFATYKGEESTREKLYSGMEIRGGALKVWLE